MAQYKIEKKTDQEILECLQSICSQVSGYELIEGEHNITTVGDLDDMEKSKIAAFFQNSLQSCVEVV